MGTNGSTMLKPLRQGLPPTGPSRVSSSASCSLSARYEAVRGARHFTKSTLQQWELSERFDDVSLVVSELVTNALRHALPEDAADDAQHPPVRLHLLRWPGRLVCAVRDPSPETPGTPFDDDVPFPDPAARPNPAGACSWWTPSATAGGGIRSRGPCTAKSCGPCSSCTEPVQDRADKPGSGPGFRGAGPLLSIRGHSIGSDASSAVLDRGFSSGDRRRALSDDGAYQRRPERGPWQRRAAGSRNRPMAHDSPTTSSSDGGCTGPLGGGCTGGDRRWRRHLRPHAGVPDRDSVLRRRGSHGRPHRKALQLPCAQGGLVDPGRCGISSPRSDGRTPRP